MATYVLQGFGLDAYSMVTGSQFRIDPDWDAERDALTFTFTDDDTALGGDTTADELGDDGTQTAVVTDADGNTVASGQIYAEEAYTLTDEFGNSVTIYTVEIGGVLVGGFSSSPLQPGNTYAITSYAQVTDANQPAYSSLASATYDQDADNAITGTSRADSIESGTGSDSVAGMGGNDTIRGGAGADTIDGGAGDDTIWGDGGTAPVFTEVANTATVTGTTGQNHFRVLAETGASATVTLDDGGGTSNDGDGQPDYVLIDSTNATNLIEIRGFDYGTDRIVLLEMPTGYSFTANPGDLQGSITYANGNTQQFRIYHSGGATFSFADFFTTDAPWDDGADSLSGGADADTFVLEDGFGADTIAGGETATVGQDYDTLDLSRLTGAVTVTFTGDGAGTVSDGTDTLSFTGIERIITTDQADVINTTGGGDVEILARGGNDSITGGSASGIYDGGAGNDTIYYGAGDDTVRGGAGNDRIDDTAGTRDVGTNFLDGGAGNDTIYAGHGDDTVYGGTGRDSIIAEEGADLVEGGGGRDSISGGSGDDTLRGDFDGTGLSDPLGKFTYEYYDFDGQSLASLADAGFTDGATNVDVPDGAGTVDTLDVDRIAGQHGNLDTFAVKLTTTLTVTTAGTYTFQLSGDDGARLFIDGTEIVQHDGLHSYSGVSGSTSLTAGAHTVEIIYFENTGDEQLGVTISGPDTGSVAISLDAAAVSQSYDDTISGGAGADVISGGIGADSLSGGDDADTFLIRNGFGNDTIAGGELGNDFDTIDLSAVTVPVTVTFTGPGAGTITDGTHTITFSQIERLVLTDAADLVDASADTAGIAIVGGDGADTITGGSGADTIDGGAGTDSIDGGAGADSIQGGAGNDTLRGGAGNDTIAGGAGQNTVDGGLGDDQLSGGSEADTILGGDGNDNISDGAGDDYVDAGAGNDTVGGWWGNDTILGGAGNDRIEGGDGADSIDGGDGDDLLVGYNARGVSSGSTVVDTDDGAADTITGGAGADTIVGGAGHDVLTGGTEGDRFLFANGSGADTITDFDTGDANTDGVYNDRIDVSAMTNTDGSPIRSWDITTVDDGFGNAMLVFPGGETIVLQGVAPSQMQTGSQYTAAGIPCFTAGTLIRTVDGARPVDSLRPGDRVITRDNGPQPLLWSAMRRLGPAELAAAPNLCPVDIAPGAYGDHGRLTVSPQHAILLTIDGDEVLVRATHLAGLPGGLVRRRAGCRRVTYCHLLFERHEIVFSNGLASESYFPGPQAVAGLDHAKHRELDALFPGLSSVAGADQAARLFGEPARAYSRRRTLPGHVRDFSAAI